jgi:hypothetical protein
VFTEHHPFRGLIQVTEDDARITVSPSSQEAFKLRFWESVTLGKKSETRTERDADLCPGVYSFTQ